jgi:hypothetical protein
MRFIKLTLTRSETTIIPLTVVPWEVPLLEAVHGGERITIDGEVEVANRDYPDAPGEFQRLLLKYKMDTDSGQDYVALVYGGGRLGVEKLEAAIKAEMRDNGTLEQRAKNEPPLTPIGDEGEDPLAGLYDPAEGPTAISE